MERRTVYTPRAPQAEAASSWYVGPGRFLEDVRGMKRGLHGRAQLCNGSGRSVLTWCDHHVHALSDTWPVPSNRFSHAPAEPVPRGGSPKSPSHYQTQTAGRQTIGSYVNNQQGGDTSGSFTIHAMKLVCSCKSPK
jgi:hypothetical protein